MPLLLKVLVKFTKELQYIEKNCSTKYILIELMLVLSHMQQVKTFNNFFVQNYQELL